MSIPGLPPGPAPSGSEVPMWRGRNVNEAVVLLLALVWAAILLPNAVKQRRRSPSQSVGGFARTMHLLNPGAPRGLGDHVGPRGGARPIVVPGSAAERIVEDLVQRDGYEQPPRLVRPTAALLRRRRMMQRRRNVLFSLAGSTGFFLLLALLVGGFATVLFLLSAAATGVYVWLLRQRKVAADQRRAVVRTLPARPADRDVAPRTMPVMSLPHLREADGGR